MRKTDILREMRVLDVAKSKQATAFSIVTYFGIEDLLSILGVLMCEGWISHYAFIYHDKDLKDDDELKKLISDYDNMPEDEQAEQLKQIKNNKTVALKVPHIHLIIITPRKLTCSKVVALFYRSTKEGEKGCNTLCEIASNVDACYDYLTHNTPECRVKLKTVYPDTDIYVSDNEYWSGKGVETKRYDTLTSCVFDILEGYTASYLLKKYGRDYIINERHIYEIVKRIRSGE